MASIPIQTESGRKRMTKDQLPPWAMRVIGTVAAVLFTGMITWMTYVSSNQYMSAQSHAEMRTQLKELEKRIDLQSSNEVRRYDALSDELHRFMERIEAKIDRIGRTGAGATGSP